MKSRCIGILTGLLLLMAVLPAMSQMAKERIAFQREGATITSSNVVVTYAGDGGSATELPESKDFFSYPRKTPALSPDGHTVAFCAKVGDKFHLFTWALDDQNQVVGNPAHLTPTDGDTDDKFPSWSPDGERLAYLATESNGKTTLRVINKDGSGIKVLADVSSFSTPSWQPNGEKLLYTDVIGGKTMLKCIPAVGGLTGIDILPESRITAACYSPDGSHIAALVLGAQGLCDLITFTPSGQEVMTLTRKISGGCSVAWPSPDNIIINAYRVGTEVGKAFWYINPSTKQIVKKISVPADPKKVNFFSVRQSDANGNFPTALNPDVSAGPDSVNGANAERPPSGPVTIIRPYADSTVRGVVTLKIAAQQSVASIVLRIGDQFSHATTVPTGEEDIAMLLYSWDTQALNYIEPSRGLPTRYEQLLKYPDGSYNITVSSFDKENKFLGRDSIKVTVQNSLPNDTLPANLTLYYKYKDPSPEERYTLHGEGLLTGASQSLSSTLNATLDAMVRRDLVEARPGNFDIRTYIDPVKSLGGQRDPRYPLTYALKEASIPETEVSALYNLSSTGDLSVIPQRREKILLPLTQLVVPFKGDAQDTVKVGSAWNGQMWVVPDLLSRRATLVRANLTVDGVELIGDRRAVRIRIDYRLDSPGTTTKLSMTPSAMPPGLDNQPDATATPAVVMTPGRGFSAAGNPMGGAPGPGMTAAPAPADDAIKVKEATGLRYAWFDYEDHKLLRVEDFVLYAFPVAAPAPVAAPQARPAAAPANPMAPAANPAANPMAPMGGPGGAPAGMPDMTGPLYIPNVGQVTPRNLGNGMAYVTGVGMVPVTMLSRLYQQFGQPNGAAAPATQNPGVGAPGVGAPGAQPGVGAPGGVGGAPSQRMVTAHYLVRMSYHFIPEENE